MIGDRVNSLPSAAEAIGNYLQQGGFVMWPLLACTVVLWFTLGYRWMLLNRGSDKSVRVLINNFLRGKPRKSKGIVDSAIERGILLQAQKRPYLRERLDEAFGDYLSEIKRFRITIGTTVSIAPLLVRRRCTSP